MKNNLRIFNTLTRKQEPFRSITAGRVNMLVCGPTIQGFMHLGHARTYIFYDMVSRYLAFLGYKVTFVLNITDIDESISKGARSMGISLNRFTAKYHEAFVSDMRKLGIGSVSAYERVSKFIPEMIVQVQSLLAGGNAYPVGGNIYFSVDTFPEFGRLSHQNREQISMHPLEIAQGKRNQADFSLWRPGDKAEPKWNSPWGRGTPGWHIQDTAVSFAHFGGHYDIHGGARELVFPHHEALIAQMESLYGFKPSVSYWVHSGLLTQRKEKIAKSRGKAPKVRDLLKDNAAGGLRLYLLTMHHREDAEFTDAGLKKWEAAYWELRTLSKSVEERSSGKLGRLSTSNPFFKAMDDDLKSKDAIDYLFGIARTGAKEREPKRAADALQLLRAASSILGVVLFEKVN